MLCELSDRMSRQFLLESGIAGNVVHSLNAERIRSALTVVQRYKVGWDKMLRGK
jgi:hypothetical protein